MKHHIAQCLRLDGQEATEVGPGLPQRECPSQAGACHLPCCGFVPVWLTGGATHLPPLVCSTQTNAATTVPVTQLPGPSQPAVLQPSVEPTQPTPQVLLTKIPSACPFQQGKHPDQYLSPEIGGGGRQRAFILGSLSRALLIISLELVTSTWRVCSASLDPHPQPTTTTENKLCLPDRSPWCVR